MSKIQMITLEHSTYNKETIVIVTRDALKHHRYKPSRETIRKLTRMLNAATRQKLARSRMSASERRIEVFFWLDVNFTEYKFDNNVKCWHKIE